MVGRIWARLGNAVGVVDRVARSIAGDTRGPELGDFRSRAQAMLELEAPWTVGADLSRVIDRLAGFGPLQPHLNDPKVSDVLANGSDEVWIDRGNGLERVDTVFESEGDLIATVERALAPLGLRIDRSAPMVDARLADGSRMHVVLPPASVDGPVVAIRRFTQRVTLLEHLVRDGTATQAEVDHLVALVSNKKTIVVAGGTGAGKTTLLNLMATAFSEDERVVTIEDAAELRFGGHVVRLEARPANAEGVGAITIRDLLRSALRLRPDRIIVGEVRGPEALDLIMALNTGHRGSLTTVHANSPTEALLRLETMALMADSVSPVAIRRQLRSAVDVVVQLERVGTIRRVSAIEEVES